jgi:hypothetical protein
MANPMTINSSRGFQPTAEFTSRREPREQHDFAANAARIDAGMDLARRGERQTVDHDGMDGAIALMGEQGGHVGREVFRMRPPACGDAVEQRAAAAEQGESGPQRQ